MVKPMDNTESELNGCPVPKILALRSRILVSCEKYAVYLTQTQAQLAPALITAMYNDVLHGTPNQIGRRDHLIEQHLIEWSNPKLTDELSDYEIFKAIDEVMNKIGTNALSMCCEQRKTAFSQVSGTNNFNDLNPNPLRH